MASIAASPPLAAPPTRRAGTAEGAAQVAAFAALAALVAQRYAALDLAPPHGRVLAAVGIAVCGGAALAATRGLGVGGVVARPVIVAGALWLALLAIGIPGHLLWPSHWGTLASDIQRGLDSLSGWLWPYRGADPWARRTVLLVLPFALVAAASLYLWPSSRALAARRLAALGLLVVLYLCGVVNASRSGWQLEGAILFALIAAWLYLPRANSVAATAWLCAAAALAVAGGSLLYGRTAWIDYRAWNPVGDTAATFQWDQLYGPMTWSRSKATMFEVQAPRSELWKVTSLDRFDGLHFLRSAAPPGGQDFVRTAIAGQWYAQAQVNVSGFRSRLLVAAGSPLEVSWLSTHPEDVALQGDETATLSSELEAGDGYYVTYYAPHPTAGQLRRAPRAYPRAYLPYTAFDLPAARQSGLAPVDLPAAARQSGPDARTIQAPAPGLALDARTAGRVLASPYASVYRLARALARGQATPYDVALRMQRFLRSNYAYDEHPPARRYPLVSFLLSDRRGYCQQFSGAMALMLRMDGIPARVAAGFLTGPYDSATHRYRVRALDAHAWVEVYFSGIGWVAFDPTPPRTTPRSLAFTPSALLAGLPGVNPTGGGRFPVPRRRPEFGPASGAAGRASSPWPIVLAVGGALSLVAGAWLLAGALRVRRALSGDGSGAVRELERALLSLGHPLAAQTTLSQLERRLATTRGPQAARYVALLRDRRYAPAGESTGPTRRDRRMLRRALTAGRGPAARLLALLVLPPAV